ADRPAGRGEPARDHRIDGVVRPTGWAAAREGSGARDRRPAPGRLAVPGRGPAAGIGAPGAARQRPPASGPAMAPVLRPGGLAPAGFRVRAAARVDRSG